jgi:ABC-type glycerol-3-phosphate transport system substrate-binding protein
MAITPNNPIPSGGVSFGNADMPKPLNSTGISPPKTVPNYPAPVSNVSSVNQVPQINPVKPVQETVIIPSNIPEAPKKQIPPVPEVVIPNLTSDNPNTIIPPSTSTSPGNGERKKGGILKVFIVIIIVALIGVGAWFAYSLFFAKKEVALTYWGLWEDDASLRPAITAFETSHPGVKITYMKQSYKQYRERLTASIDRGDGPDVFRFHNTWVPMLQNQLFPAPKETITPDIFSAQFYPVARNDLVANTTIYGVPLGFDGLGLYINDDMFAAAQAATPITWEDVLALVPKLTVKSETGITTSAIALGTTNNVENFSDIIATMIMQNGGNLVDPSGNEAQEALIYYRKFADPADPVYTWNATFDNSIYAFATGKVAMILAPSWRAFDIKQINPAANFKIVPMPQLPGNTVNWASYWAEGVSAKSKNPKIAWEFINYLTGKEGSTKVYTEAAKIRLFGEPYARKDLAQTVGSDKYVSAYLSEAATAKSFPLASRTFDNGLNDKMIKYVEDAVNSVGNGNSPEQALQTVTSGFRQVLNQYGLTVSSAQTTP